MNDVLIALIGFTGTLTASVLLFTSTRGRTRTDATTELAKLVNTQVRDELTRVYARMDTLAAEVDRHEKWRDAVEYLIRSLAAQWPGDTPPHIEPSVLGDLEDTLPVQWRRSERNL